MHGVRDNCFLVTYRIFPVTHNQYVHHAAWCVGTQLHSTQRSKGGPSKEAHSLRTLQTLGASTNHPRSAGITSVRCMCAQGLGRAVGNSDYRCRVTSTPLGPRLSSYASSLVMHGSHHHRYAWVQCGHYDAGSGVGASLWDNNNTTRGSGTRGSDGGVSYRSLPAMDTPECAPCRNPDQKMSECLNLSQDGFASLSRALHLSCAKHHAVWRVLQGCCGGAAAGTDPGRHACNECSASRPLRAVWTRPPQHW